ncbi:MAG: DDE-type integrase/transposase/recombinase [Desulfovibrionales bacterium]|nr:DDE-type integrase/transposase/recombinase [Desulfovibrionales bacterium]
MAVQILVMSVPGIKPVNLELREPPVRCTSEGCGSADCAYYQARPRKAGGTSHRYRCADCGSRFTFRPGFLGRHYPSRVITDVLEDVTTGKSLAAAVRGLKKRSCAGVNRTPARSSACRWVRDADREAARIYEDMPMPVSGKWAVDEIYVRTLGRAKYMFGVMDSESRFVAASDVSDTKLDYDATGLFEKAAGLTRMIPRVLVSDRLPGFARGFKNVMAKRRRRRRGSRARPDPPPPCHIRSASIRKLRVNNNCRERLSGTIRDRTRTARGFSSESPALLGLLVTYYNFLRPHTGLGGRTPAGAPGVSVRGTDKRATLLAYAAAYC